MNVYVHLLPVLVINHFMVVNSMLSPVVLPSKTFFTLNDGNKMPAVALGTSLGHSSDGRRMLSVNRSVEIAVQWALEAGYRHLETSAISKMEHEVGLGVKSFINRTGIDRDQYYITTKLWNDAHENDQVVPALKKSLTELQMDYVDLYLVQYPMAYKPDGNMSHTDYLTTWKGMEEAKSLNLTRSIGVSNFNLTQLQRLWNNSVIKPAVVQIQVNPTITQEAMVNWCQDHGIVVMSHNPFGSILSQDKTAPLPRANDHYLQLLVLKYNKNLPQVLMRFLLDRNISVVMPRWLHKDRIRQTIDVFNFRLTPEEIKNLAQFNKNYTITKRSSWQNHPHFPF